MATSASTTPPYSITPRIVHLVAQITEAMDGADAAGIQENSRLQRINRVRAINGSLAIEGNILGEKQISALMDGKPAIGSLRDIQEARNAIKAYEKYPQWNPTSEADLLDAHEVLTLALLDSPATTGVEALRLSAMEKSTTSDHPPIACHNSCRVCSPGWTARLSIR